MLVFKNASSFIHPHDKTAMVPTSWYKGQPFVKLRQNIFILRWNMKAWDMLHIKHTNTNNSKSSILTVDNADMIRLTCNLFREPLGGSRVHKVCWLKGNRKRQRQRVNRRTTRTCRVHVVGTGVVAKYWVEVNVKALRIVWLLGYWGGCKPWWSKEKTISKTKPQAGSKNKYFNESLFYNHIYNYKPKPSTAYAHRLIYSSSNKWITIEVVF